jgi:hypothetical protein
MLEGPVAGMADKRNNSIKLCSAVSKAERRSGAPKVRKSENQKIRKALML